MVKKREYSAVASSDDAGASSGALASGGHDYSKNAEGMVTDVSEEEFPPLPLTPSKPPVIKKKAPNQATSLPKDDIYAQLASITELINMRSDAIEDKIAGLNNKVEAVANDVKDVSNKMAVLEQRVDSLEMHVKLLQRRVDELESYTRRWNLKLVGVPETENENTRLVVINICQMVLPSMKEKLVDVIDTVHRLGNKRQPSSNTRPRAIILQFISRLGRDAVWKAAKDSPYMKDHGLQLKEDFPKGGREEAEILKAGAAGKVASMLVPGPSSKEKGNPQW